MVDLVVLLDFAGPVKGLVVDFADLPLLWENLVADKGDIMENCYYLALNLWEEDLVADLLEVEILDLLLQCLTLIEE